MTFDAALETKTFFYTLQLDQTNILYSPPPPMDWLIFVEQIFPVYKY